jgi:hypothetical protein
MPLVETADPVFALLVAASFCRSALLWRTAVRVEELSVAL